MPSFLNKVFGYKKHDDKETTRPTREASDSSLLDGKYEAISPVTPPSAASFTEAHPSRDSDRDVGFSLFRPKTRGVSQKQAQKRAEDIPHLALRLPGPKETSDSRALGVVFEADPDSQILLDDAVIAAKRLSPLEALILVRACAHAIAERGLETLGIMHPHWFSASADVQRRLISLFIRSLTQTRITTFSPTPASPSSAFENELHYTRSSHDVAAVLRWGLRHLSLENGHFGKDSAEWGWYNAFFQAERDASYPPRGFSELLVPHLPAPHAELLTTTLSLISSLASHAEVNSISGSKLSKFLGLWLLIATRAEQSDDWNRFYARWERSGRILEHLFLARLRDESISQRLPTRLQELVKYYPYSKGALATDDDLLPRPRFSTRQYDALFVRVNTLLTHNAEQPKQHPIQLLIEAFQLPIDNASGDEHIALWNTLKTAVFAEADSPDPGGPQFSRIFVDETIHLLSLIPAGNNTPTSPTFLTSPITPIVSREPSSISKALERAISRSNANNVSNPTTPTSPSSFVITDWAQFTLSGFGDTPTTQPLSPLTNRDDDIEVTQPPTRKSSRRRGKSRTRRRRSEEDEPSDARPPDPEPSIVETKLASVRVVQIDEAFIDFWSDAIVDPISANWPMFIICGLKQIPSVQQAISWLIIEQGYSRQEPQPSRVPSPDGRRGRSPRPSFKSDISGFRINSVFASARKRFSVFNKSATDLDIKKSGGKTVIAGEFGEALVEEEPTPSQAGVRIDGNGTVRAAVTSGATTDVTDQMKADQSSTPIAGISSAPAVKEESTPVQIAAKPPSIEPTPQSISEHNGSAFMLPPPPVRPLDETILVERGSPRTLDVVNSRDGGPSTSVAKIAPPSADSSDLRLTQDTPNLTAPASEPAPPVGNTVIQEVQVRRGDAVEDERPAEPVGQTAAHDERLRADHTAELSSRTPEIIALAAAVTVVAADVVDKAPDPTVQESHVAEQPPQTTSADPAAVFSVESVDVHEIDDHSPVPATEIIAIATEAQLEPRLATCVPNKVEEAKGVSERAEIPTPAPERVALVEAPGQEVLLDAGAARVPSVVKSEEEPDAAAPHEVVDGAASQPVAAELQATLEGEASSFVEAIPPVDGDLEAAVVDRQHAANQVPHTTAIDVQAHVQDAIVSATETPESLFHEDRIDETLETETPASNPEQRESVGETWGPDVHEQPIEAVPVIPPEFVVEAETREPVVEAAVEAIPLAEEAQPLSEAEVPTQAHDVQAADVLSTEPNPEATIAALATVDEVVAAKAETHPALDISTESAEAHTPILGSVPVVDTLEVANGASEVPEPATVVNEEAQVLVPDATPIASEPVAIIPIATIIQGETAAHDVPAPIEIDQPSRALAPQSVDDDDERDPPGDAVALSVPEEIVVVEADTLAEPKVVPPTEDTADDEPVVVEDAEPAPLAPIEETEVLVAGEPEILAVEPAVVEVRTLAPLEVEEPAREAAEAAESVVASPSEVVPTVGVNETTKVEIEVVVVNDGEPVDLAGEPAVDLADEPAVVEVSVPGSVVEDAPVPVKVEESAPVVVEVFEDVVASQPTAAVEAEESGPVVVEAFEVSEAIEVVVAHDGELTAVEASATAPVVEDALAPVEVEGSAPGVVEGSEEDVASPPEVTSTVVVDETTEIEVIVVSDGEPVVATVEPAVIVASEPTLVVEDAPAPVEAEGSETSEDVMVSQPVAPVEESAPEAVEATKDASQPEVASTVVVNETTEIEVVVDNGEPVVVVSATAPVVEDASAPVEMKESATVEASEDVVNQPKTVPTIDASETAKVDEPLPVTSEIIVSTHELVPHTEIAPMAS